MDGLSVVKGSRKADAARAFVRYASRSSTRAPLPANDPTRVSAPESIDPISSVRLKVEQDQLVSGGWQFDLGPIGLQGA